MHIGQFFRSDNQNQHQKLHLPAKFDPIPDKDDFFPNFGRNFRRKKNEISKLHGKFGRFPVVTFFESTQTPL